MVHGAATIPIPPLCALRTRLPSLGQQGSDRGAAEAVPELGPRVAASRIGPGGRASPASAGRPAPTGRGQGGLNRRGELAGMRKARGAVSEIVGSDEREVAQLSRALGDHQGILPCPARPLIRFHELDHRPRNPKPAVSSAIEADPVEKPPVYFLCRGFADRALSHSARPPVGPRRPSPATLRRADWHVERCEPGGPARARDRERSADRPGGARRPTSRAFLREQPCAATSALFRVALS